MGETRPQHKTIKNVSRCDSVTEILFMLGLPSFGTLLHNSRVVFLHAWCKCPNMLVSHSLICNRWCHVNVFNVHVGLF